MGRPLRRNRSQSSHLSPKTQEAPIRGELAASDRIVDVTSIARVQRFVNRTLRGFEEGVFDGLEPIAWKQDKPGVFLAPGYDFLPGAVGQLYGEMIRIEWHPPFDWSPLKELAEALDDDPCGAASLDGSTLCQLLVAHGRAERFCDGLFLKRVESGQIRALLARVKVFCAGRSGPVSGLQALRGVPPRRIKAKPRRCTACRSSRIASILYGEPCMDSEMERRIKEGRLVLGGCCIGDDDPAWQCVTCGALVHVTGCEDPNDPNGMAWQLRQL